MADGLTPKQIAARLTDYVGVVTGELPGLITDKPYHNCEIWDLENCRDFVLAIQGLAKELDDATTPDPTSNQVEVGAALQEVFEAYDLSAARSWKNLGMERLADAIKALRAATQHQPAPQVEVGAAELLREIAAAVKNEARFDPESDEFRDAHDATDRVLGAIDKHLAATQHQPVPGPNDVYVKLDREVAADYVSGNRNVLASARIKVGAAISGALHESGCDSDV